MANNQISNAASQAIDATQDAQYFVHLYLPYKYHEDDIQALAENCFDEALAVITHVEDGQDPALWKITWLLPRIPDLSVQADLINLLASSANLSPEIIVSKDDFQSEIVPDQDWLAQSIENFAPFSIGDFHVFDSYYKDRPDLGIAPGQIPLEINASIAFGTGQHPTTKGCLLALKDIADGVKFDTLTSAAPNTILDMGCGTAILAIAAAKLWDKADILAIDNDADSVDVAIDHLRMNDITTCRAVFGEGFQTPELVNGNISYDLILANILPRPLQDMAGDLCAALSDGGLVILSGLLIEQEQGVIDCYINHGLDLVEKYHVDDWSSLIMKKPA